MYVCNGALDKLRIHGEIYCTLTVLSLYGLVLVNDRSMNIK